MDLRPPSAGARLREVREARGRTLREVARTINVSPEYLRLLEEGDYAGLPERPLARGYLRRYAAELGMDAAAALAEFDRAVPPRPETRPAPGETAPRGAVLPWAALLSAAVLLGALGWFGYALWQSRAAVAPPPAAVTAPPAPERQIRLSVTSTPKGARVYLDNRYLGQTPVKNFPLEARPGGQLRLELEGYTKVVRQISLKRSRELRIGLSPTSPAGEKQAP